jgi:uncharacterized protein YfaS (alpha-2-macroglobulin family)
MLVALLVLAAAYFSWNHWHHAATDESVDADASLAVVNVANREEDGSPAIVITFSIPIDKFAKGDIELYQDTTAPAIDKTKTEDSAASDDSSDDDSGNVAESKEQPVDTKVSDADLSAAKLISSEPKRLENPRLLAFTGVKANTRYLVRIKPQVVAKNGKVLQSEARFALVSPTVSPAYYFASNGMVLPAKGNGGLPVTTVNVSEVDVQFLRVRDDQLPTFLDRVISGPHVKSDEDDDSPNDDGLPYNYHRSFKGAVSFYDLDTLHNLTTSVYQARFVTEKRKDKRSVTFLPVEDIKELKEPGVYVAVMSQPNRFRDEFQTTYFYVSDLGLQSRAFDKSADAYVSSLTDGKPVKGVEISYIDQQGKVLAHGQTDGDGHANFAERPRNARVLMARLDKQISLLALKEPALDLSEYSLAGGIYKPVHLFAYSGRDLYRPGESFDVSVMARDADGKPVPPQPIQVTLKRPDGQQQIQAMVKPDTRFPGYYLQHLELPTDAPTGLWTIEFRSDPADKVAGTVLSVHVEEFLPERMKLDLKAPDQISAASGNFDVSVLGAYLYGAPAAGNTVKVTLSYNRAENPLADKLPGFSFGDVKETDSKTRTDLDDLTLDAQGKGDFSVDLAPVKDKHSAYLVRSTVSLLESGGRPVIRNLDRTVWPAEQLIGIRPLFQGDYATEDSPADFEVVRVDQKGNLLAEAGLPVKLYREDRNYYWRFDDQRGWNSGFTESDELVATQTVSLTAGQRAKLRVPVRYGRYRVEIFDPASNQTLVYRFYAGWSARDDESAGVRPDRVALKLDKAAYKPGDTVHVEMKPPHAGEVLLTVEGDRTLWVKRSHVGDDGGSFDIPLDKSWAREDLYLTAMVLRPGNAGDRVTPTRALGIERIGIDHDQSKLAVTLDAPAKALPETTVHVKVKAPDAHGQQAVVTLSAVDVGILNITEFVSPDPFASFFGRLRYGAELRDVYGRLIERFAGQKGKLRYGGDAAGKRIHDLPKKVKLVDLFSGPVALDAQGEADIPVSLPDFNGTLRLMAVVATADRFGSKDQELTVAAPIVAELSTPRFLSFGDTSTIALDLTNLSGHDESISVAVSSGDGLSIANTSRQVSLKNGEKQTMRFDASAGQQVALVPVGVKVTSSDVHLDRQFALQIEAPTPPQTASHRFVVKPGDSADLHMAELGEFFPGTVTGHITVSSNPPIDIRAAIQGLLEYPYGCVEQTTSTAYPFVFVDEDAARRYGLKAFTREQREAILNKVFAKLAALQSSEGGFSLWGGSSNVEVWLTAFVADFLADAKAQGFDVPEGMQKKALDWLFLTMQKNVPQLSGHAGAAAASGNDQTFNDYYERYNHHFDPLVYAAFVLAREKRAPIATLKQLFDARANSDSPLSLSELSIALKLMGDDKRSATAASEAIAKHRPRGGWWWGEYGSDVRDSAMSYALLTKYKAAPANVADLLNALVGQVDAHSRYYSTSEQMALFLAGDQLLAQAGDSFTTQLQKPAGSATLEGTTPAGSELSSADLAQIKLTNSGAGSVFVEVSMHGNPQAIAPSNAINVEREVLSAAGTPLGNVQLKVGDGVLVHLRARSRDYRTNVLVIDRIPAGLEIENSNIAQGEGLDLPPIGGVKPSDAMSSQRITHVEFREDRFVAAVHLAWYEPVDLFYRARVVTPGKFASTGTYAEDMYQPQVYGTSSVPAPLVISDGLGGRAGKQAAAAPAAPVAPAAPPATAPAAHP